MRTTIRIDDELLTEAKLRAARSGRTLAAVVEDALREAFASRPIDRAERVGLPRFRGSHQLPGVDLDDSAVLVERMESRES
jgi:Arc/MetJ family transcription regulator